MKALHPWVALAIVIAGSACGGTPKPTEQLGQTQAALRAAQEIGAEEVPQAKMLSKVADEEVQEANKLMADGDNAAAHRILARARADAELSLALARRAKAERELQQLQAAVTPTSSTTQSVSMAADGK